MPDHEKLQALLNDRKSSSKGRATAKAHVCLDAEAATQAAIKRNELQVVKDEVERFETEAKGDARMGGTVPVPEEMQKRLADAQTAYDEAQDAANDATVSIVMVALKSADFDLLLKAHPPRDGNKEDDEFGADRSSFLKALAAECATKVLDQDGAIVDMEAADILGTLSSGERAMIEARSLEINQRTASVPFSIAGSPSRQLSGGKSKRR